MPATPLFIYQGKRWAIQATNRHTGVTTVLGGYFFPRLRVEGGRENSVATWATREQVREVLRAIKAQSDPKFRSIDHWSWSFDNWHKLKPVKVYVTIDW